MPHFTPRELEILRRLREGFLTGGPGRDYWRADDELALYDATFGERIGWKWDAVLGELEVRGWRPKSTHALDWGCGSGIAGRRVLAKWPGQFRALAVHDRSALAMRHAEARARADFPETEIGLGLPAIEDGLLLVSHVLNELPANELARLLSLARKAREVIWVEAGTHAESRRLGAEVREPLRAAGFRAVAPCTHSQACGMFASENARHWCHSFARPPSSVFQDARWAALADELGLDLRSLPYSFLVLEKESGPADSGGSRVIGHPREYKGFLKVLSSQADGVAELTLQKRDAPALWREVRSGDGLPIYRWERVGGKIVGGETAH